VLCVISRGGVEALFAISSLSALPRPFLSDPLLVVLNHLRTFVFVPERSVLRRNGGSTSPAPEAVTVRALMRMDSVIMVVSVAVPRCILVAGSAPLIITSVSISALSFPLPLPFSFSLLFSVILILWVVVVRIASHS